MKNIPVTIPYFTEAEEQAAVRAIRSGWVAQGPNVEAFEKAVTEHEKIKYGVATTSCTTALHLAMISVGLSEGFDVLAPAFTFVATVNSIVSTGAIPVLVDIDINTFNISIQHMKDIIKENYKWDGTKLINKSTYNVLWGIVPVHQFGLCCNIIEIQKIAIQFGLRVIEDAACALGAKMHEYSIGALSDAACISFHPRKSITTGEGGMVLTEKEDLAEKMKQLRSHGSSISADKRHLGKGYLLPDFDYAGFNYRMTDIQAAIGLEQCKKLDYILSVKREKADYYNQLISKNVPEFIIPIEPEGYFHTYQSYVCRLDYGLLNARSLELAGMCRNLLLEELENNGISTRQGTHAVHLLGYYQERFKYRKSDFPAAYEADHLSIALPLYVQMTKEEQEMVIRVIRKILDKGDYKNAVD